MKNKILAVFMAVMLAFCMMPATAHAATGTVTIGDFTWGYATLTDNTCEITKFTDNGTNKSTDINFPGSLTIGGTKYTVTQIGDAVNEVWVIQNNTDVKTVTVPEGVTLIGKYAFGDSKIVSAKLPESLRTVCYGAFYQTYDLATVMMPDHSVTDIGANAFLHDKNLASCTLPQGLLSIGDEAFEGTKLTALTIPASVATIGQAAFNTCPLESIRVESGNTHFTCPDGILFNSAKTRLLMYLAKNAGSAYIIPNTVTGIDDFAFLGAVNLTSITIPKSVVSIGQYAFAGCGITSLTLPDGVSELKDLLFMGCTSLKNVTVLNPSAKFGNSPFYGCKPSDGLYGFAGSTTEKYALDNKITFHTLFKAVFNSKGGSAVGYGYAVSGGKISRPQDPKRTGYIFDGWYKDSAYKNAWNFNTDTLSANTTLYAKWIQIKWMGRANKMPAKAVAGTAWVVKPVSAPKGYTQKSVGYASSNKNIVSIDKNGTATFKKGGSVKITVTTKFIKGKTTKTVTTVKKVTVKQLAASIALNKTTAQLVVGETLSLKVTFNPSSTTDKSVIWKSSNTKVATVSGKGVVTAKKKGKAFITCTAKDGSKKTASCTVTVP